MSDLTIRAGIQTLMSAVTDIGVVYDYERWANDWATFVNLFKTTVGGVDQIRGWEIGRKAPGKEDSSTIKEHTYFIRGYMGVNDSLATEKTFNALVDSVSAAFRNSVKTRPDWAEGHGYIQTDVLDTRMFGGVMCHFVELTLTVYEFIG